MVLRRAELIVRRRQIVRQYRIISAIMTKQTKLTPSPTLPTSASERLRDAYWQVLHDLDAMRLQQWEKSRLTLPQLRVLFQVRRSPDITTGHLSKLLGVTMSTASGLVGKLVNRGLLIRGVSEDDRRQIPLRLTPQGQRLAGELAGATRPFLDGVVEELGGQINEVTEALEMLAAAAARARAQ
jgi:DNA-binding MarR family transcriptional regulator